MTPELVLNIVSLAVDALVSLAVLFLLAGISKTPKGVEHLTYIKEKLPDIINIAKGCLPGSSVSKVKKLTIDMMKEQAKKDSVDVKTKDIKKEFKNL